MTKRILLVDDDQPFRESVREILESEGFQVTECSDAIYAMPHIKEPFDLAITDIMMAEMDGNQLAHAIRQGNPNLPVLGMTGGGRIGSADRIKSFCPPRLFTTILSKPFLAEELLEAVNTSIG